VEIVYINSSKMRVDLQLWHNFNQTNLPTSSEVYEEANVSVLLEMKYEIYGQKNKQTRIVR